MTGFKTFAPSEVLTSSDLNEYLMRQAIAIFPDTATRDASITSPVNGQHCYVQAGAGNLYRWNGSTWVDATVRGYQAYTPTIGASPTSPTFSSVVGRWTRLGDRVGGSAVYTFATGGSGTYSVGLPTPAGASNQELVGTAVLTDASASNQRYVGGLILISSTTAFLNFHGSAGNGSQATPITIASGDTLRIAWDYEGAA